jgi:peroxiredoxin
MLSDPGSITIDAYKIRNTKVRPGRAEGIPHPTIFLVNKEGKITAKLREENFRERPTIEAIVAAAKKIDG